MSNLRANQTRLPPDLEAIRAKCFHPTGTFIEFAKEEIEQSIPERFEKIVQRYPDRLAVKMGLEAVTYAQLNAMANQIAHEVLELLGDRWEPVAVCFERDIGSMAALLGVLKAGKALVLLDPSFPAERLNSTLDDASARLILARAERLSPNGLADKFALLNLARPPSSSSACNPAPKPGGDDTACIAYTSGSTGAPKGVVWNHRNLLHNNRLLTNAYHVCCEDRIVLFTSATMVAATNIFLALLSGAALFPLDIQKEGVEALAELLARERISICWMSSRVLRAFHGSIAKDIKFPDVRILRLGSEASAKADVDIFRQHFSEDCCLVTGLATSEVGMLSVWFSDGKNAPPRGSIPIGYPLSDKDVLIVDDCGKELGIDEVGEIAVRSRFISSGYWRRPELTAAAFVPDSRGGEERIYFTGDLALRRSDGCLQHMGRKDFQAKIRGYRVEVSEIEAALAALASVRSAVVHAISDDHGVQRLVAYVVPAARMSPNVSEIRHALARSLPHYMIPGTFVFLDAIPLLPNGKVNRIALPLPDRSRPPLKTTYVAPATSIETDLAKIWAEVLSLEPVGMDDNFFDLGGNSLTAMRVASGVLKHFQLEIPLQALFDSPTIAQMAKAVEKNLGNRMTEAKLERLINEIERMPEEEAQRLLALRAPSQS